MVDFKVVISDPKSGKSYSREAKDSAADALLGKSVGDKVAGDALDLHGYEFEITGGSDLCGFPLRRDVDSVRKRILAVKGVGFKHAEPGVRQRRTVCGHRITQKVSQVNLKVLKHGKARLGSEKAEA